LLTRPERWQQLVSAPELVPQAVAESNRYMPAIVTWLRETAREVNFDGESLPEGTRVLVHIGAANRDMLDGDTFDLNAKRKRTLSFGAGPHYCVGAFLALREAEVVLRELLKRFPNLRLSPGRPLIGEENVAFPSPRSLWVDTV
jgi:cytochrome P450